MNRRLWLTLLRLSLSGIVFITLSSTSCTSKQPDVSTPSATQNTSTISTTPSYLSLLQQNKKLAVSFSALMTFDAAGKNITFPSEFNILPISITWESISFSGRREETGPGEDVTDQVSGTVSANGTMLVSLVYSRQIIRTTNIGTFFRVTLQNLPIVRSTDSGSGFESIDRAGADLQKYIVQIEYSDGPLSAGQIVPATVYLSTDWNNTQAGQIPTLRVNFGN